MEQNPSWEINICLGTQQIPCILLNPKIQCHVLKSLPLVPVMSQNNPVQTFTSHLFIYLKCILILFSHLCINLPTALFNLKFPAYTLCAFLSSSMHATCCTHFILLDLITWGVFVGVTGPVSCNFFPLGPSYSWTPLANSSLNVTDLVSLS